MSQTEAYQSLQVIIAERQKMAEGFFDSLHEIDKQILDTPAVATNNLHLLFPTHDEYSQEKKLLSSRKSFRDNVKYQKVWVECANELRQQFEEVVLINDLGHRVIHELTGSTFMAKYLFNLGSAEIGLIHDQVHTGKILEFIELREKALSFFYEKLAGQCEKYGLDVGYFIR